MGKQVPTLLAALIAAFLLASAHQASAQTDALVVDESGRVGVNTSLIGPNESFGVTAALKASGVKVPRKCERGPVPVQIEFSDAVTGAELLTEQAMLSPEKRAVTATLDPLGGGVSAVQVVVLTQKAKRLCVTWNATAIGTAGLRALGP